jgi:peptide/nickel transport system ATP-binding protein
MSSSLIEVKHICHRYGRLRVLDDVSFSIDAGETLGLFGVSGSGKTTIGRVLMLLERPLSGEIRFEGKELLCMSKREVFFTRPKMQMIFQNPEGSLNPKMRTGESIAEPLMIHSHGDLSRDEIDVQVARLAEMVGLRKEHLQRFPQQMSGGEIQRAVLARIISLHPKFVVADEVTSMLDASVQAQVLRLMMRLQKETDLSYLFISHDLDLLTAIADRIAYIDNGKITRIEDNKNKRI